jgi:hypothetical protein
MGSPAIEVGPRQIPSASRGRHRGPFDLALRRDGCISYIAHINYELGASLEFAMLRAVGIIRCVAGSPGWLRYRSSEPTSRGELDVARNGLRDTLEDFFRAGQQRGRRWIAGTRDPDSLSADRGLRQSDRSKRLLQYEPD